MTDRRPTPISAEQQGAVDLLGVLAYGALLAFDRLAADARKAPSLAERVHVAHLAARQMAHFRRVQSRLAELGTDETRAVEPVRGAFDAFHRHAEPNGWFEGLVWSYVAQGIAADFYREIAAFVDPLTQAVVLEVLAEEPDDDFVVRTVRAGVRADPRLAGRLALWGRRLVGEALSQAQRVAADRPSLTSLLTGTGAEPGMDLAVISQTFARLIENHTVRMRTLGLQS